MHFRCAMYFLICPCCLFVSLSVYIEASSLSNDNALYLSIVQTSTVFVSETVPALLWFFTVFSYALTWTPTVSMLGCYFEKRWPVAKALASTGEWIVTFFFTPFIQFLVDNYSWRGAMLVLGAVQLHQCVRSITRPLTVISDELFNRSK